jgi:hypothetical protein
MIVMARKMTSVVLFAGLLITMGGAAIFGCAGERDPIDRVQPYALEKALFVGQDLQDPADNPEFWTQGTLVDVGGYGASQDGLFVSTYAQSLSRMKWQITEDTLLGRLAYERIEGSDGKGVGKATNDGTIVVAFRIEKHFDIVKAYNPTTGEELNILEENVSDRPWYQRKYMRVDWSKNLATDSYDFDTLSLLGVYGGITYEPLTIDVTDPADPNAPVFDLENGYFDVTNKAFAKPGLVDLSSFGWGIDTFPACFLPDEFMSGSFPSGSCNPIELTIRQSFRKVTDSDYEPEDWDGYKFQAYGAFTTERYGYARNYGMTDELWHRFVDRFNIWERSHYYSDPASMTGPIECFTPDTTPFGADPHRDEDGNGTEDECETVGSGSRCDTFRQRCTLPFTQRTPVTTPWYVTEGSNLEYFEASEHSANDWDVALRIAVRSAQYTECQSTGGANCQERFPIFFGQEDDSLDAVQLAWDIDLCRNGRGIHAGEDCDALAETLGNQRGVDPAVISIARMPEMIVLCHSPVQANDPVACGEPRLPEGILATDCQQALENRDMQTMSICKQAISARLGDLRYHQVNLIREPETPSPWGIYTGSIDPLTGEMVADCVNVWTHVNDFYAQFYVDLMRYINKELTTSDITEGTWVRDWSQAAAAAAGGGAMPRLTRNNVTKELVEFTGGTEAMVAPRLEGQAARLPPEVMAAARKLRSELKGVKASLKATSTMSPIYAARRQAARGTQFEAELMTPMVQQMMGVQGIPLNDKVMDIVSPLRGGNPGVQRELYNLKQAALGKRAACIMSASMASAPLSLTGLADVMQQKFGNFNRSDSKDVQQARAEHMRSYLARHMHYAVIVHEMGHGMGLRHNFVSSSDAWGYRPQYWQLRTKDGTVTTECTELSADGENCVGPRYYDPVTPEEQSNLIWMWMHSSVMDYPGEATQDLLGLGVWDFAAARMFYGGVVAVNRDASYDVGSGRSRLYFDKMDSFGGITGIQHSLNGKDFNYSQLQNKLRLISGCEAVPDPQVFKPGDWDTQKDGVWSPLLDGLIVQVDGSYTRCKQEKVDYDFWNSLRYPTEAELAGGYYQGGTAIDGQGRVRMPYGFATDHWADLGNLSVYRHDNGADAYEIFNWMITAQEVNYIFDNFRRGKTTFSVRSAANRTLERYNTKLRDGAKGLGLMKNIYEDFARDSGYDADGLWPYIASEFYKDNIIASTQVFDHFTRMLERPESGEHFFLDFGDPVLRSTIDAWANPGPTQVVIPNGATGYYGDIGIGGKLVENQLSKNNGDYDSDITINAGSYYEKLNTAMLMTESVDNYISSSRSDFVDPRYRSISIADLFPEGYRRWLANNLTGDEMIKGPRLVANADGSPQRDLAGFPDKPIGWTTWWTEEPEVCFPDDGTTLCSIYGDPSGGALNPLAPQYTAVVDPEVGWEQQKFLIAWTMLYLPENEKLKWLDMLRLWELGIDADPQLGNNRIEFHNPGGKRYVAKTFGKEVIFGKTVQRGIAARVLEYANELLYKAYETTDGPDLDGDGHPDWFMPVFSSTTGQPIVRYDPTIMYLDENGGVHPTGRPGCDATDNSECTCASNRDCVELSRYVTVPAYMREALEAYQLGEPGEKGIYD